MPLESFSPTGSTVRFPAPVTTFPVTVNPASPLTRVMFVPAGNVSVDPSDPRSMIGSVVGEPKSRVYELDGAEILNDRWSPSAIGGVNIDSENRLLDPSTVDDGGSSTTVPENVTS